MMRPKKRWFTNFFFSLILIPKIYLTKFQQNIKESHEISCFDLVIFTTTLGGYPIDRPRACSRWRIV